MIGAGTDYQWEHSGVLICCYVVAILCSAHAYVHHSKNYEHLK